MGTLSNLKQIWDAKKTIEKRLGPIKEAADLYKAAQELENACEQWAKDPSAENRKKVDDAFVKQYKEVLDDLPLPYPAVPKKIRNDLVDQLAKDRFGDDMRKALDDLEWRKGRDDTYLNDLQKQRCRKDIVDKFNKARLWRNPKDPLVLDLDGDGIETVGADTGIRFDHDADGTKQGTGWVKGDDGFLALDINGNGTIDSGRELFGDNSLLPDGSIAVGGFQALQAYDSNGDGQIDHLDSVWSQLRVWRDRDGSGTSRSDELFTLDQLGIASLSLNKATVNGTGPDGNTIQLAGHYTTTSGAQKALSQLGLAEDAFNTEDTQQVVIPEDIKDLPNITGFGLVKDLHSAAALSPAVKAAYLSLVASTSPAELATRLDALLDAWITTATVPSQGLTSYTFESIPQFDGNGQQTPEYTAALRKLHILEIFNGSMLARPGSSSATLLSQTQADLLLSGYDDMKAALYDELAPGTILLQYTSKIEVEEVGEDTYLHFEQLEAHFEARYLQDPAAAVVELMDLCRLEAKQFRSVGWDALAFAEQAMQGKAIPLAAQTQYGRSAVKFGSSNDDTLAVTGAGAFGFDGNDVINSDAGSQVIIGGDGNDTITDDGGNDIIVGGNGNDVIVDRGGDNTITGGAGDDSIQYWHQGSNTIEGNAGNDVIAIADDGAGNYANSENRVIGGTGNDTIRTGSGADTFVFNRGDGQDTWRDNATVGYSGGVQYDPGNDTLEFGTGISQADLAITRSGSDLLVKVNDPSGVATSDQITIKGWFGSEAQVVETFKFADGSTMTKAQVQALSQIITGTSGDDTINSDSSNDTVRGLGGNDTITDAGGDDVIEGGDGNDTIVCWRRSKFDPPCRLNFDPGLGAGIA